MHMQLLKRLNGHPLNFSIEYGGGHPKFSHFNQKKSQCSPNCATAPTTHDNKLNTEIARKSSYLNFSVLLYQIIAGGG